MSDKPVLAWVPTDNIRIDRKYQRALNMKHAQRIADNFDWRFFQPPSLTSVPRTQLYDAVDGQHRITGAKLAGVPEVPSYITEAATLEERAKLFVALNTQVKQITPVDRYHAAITAKIPEYVDLENTLEKAGVSIVPYVGFKGEGVTTAVSGLLRLMKSCGPDVVESSVRVLYEAHPESTEPIPASFISAVSRFYHSTDDVDLGLLTEVLSEQDFSTLGAQAYRQRKLEGGTAASILLDMVASRYEERVNS